jgi:hypothetical protein
MPNAVSPKKNKDGSVRKASTVFRGQQKNLIFPKSHHLQKKREHKKQSSLKKASLKQDTGMRRYNGIWTTSVERKDNRKSKINAKNKAARCAGLPEGAMPIQDKRSFLKNILKVDPFLFTSERQINRLFTFGKDFEAEHREKGKRKATLADGFAKEMKLIVEATNDGKVITWFEDMYIRKVRQEVTNLLNTRHLLLLFLSLISYAYRELPSPRSPR